MMALTPVFFVVLAIAIEPGTRQRTAKPLDWAADDEKRVAELATRGRRLEGAHVIVWMPAAVPEKEHRTLVERLDRGVPALRGLVGRHDWQVVGEQKLTYYVSEDRFISHATGQAAVFIPLARVDDGRAPYLHEAAHELLATAEAEAAFRANDLKRLQARPLWLSEGLADYLAQSAASKAGTAEGDVFGTGGLEGADRTCADRLRQPAGPTILPFIGANGRPEGLFTTDRQTVAPTFYTCAFSFTKFVVDRTGLASTIALVPLMGSTWQDTLESSAGKNTGDLRSDWLRAIGYKN
jgi:hypothetical protein